MNRHFSFLLGLAFLASIVFAEDKSAGYSQSYVILIKDAVAGSETVTEKRDDSGNIVSTSEHEMFVTDGLDVKRMTFSTKMVLTGDGKRPVSLKMQYVAEGGTPGDSYDIQVRNNQVTRVLTRNGKSSEATAEYVPNMVIFDNTVYHQLEFLVRRYEIKKGGRQLFQYFVPVIGNDIPMALTFLGDENLELKTGKLPVKNFRIECSTIWGGTFSVDKNDRLVRLYVPAQSLEVVRKDLFTPPAAKP